MPTEADVPTSDGPTPDAADILAALPGAVIVIDAVGTVRFATPAAAAMVGTDVDHLVGESVLRFVSEETAWMYAAAVAMAEDYPEQVTGPLRVTFLTVDGEPRRADLWADNRLDNPAIRGIVCLLTPETTAVWLGDALVALAGDAEPAQVAAKVVEAMRGNPVVGDAALVGLVPGGFVVEASHGVPDAVLEAMRSDSGPWRDAATSGVRQVRPDLAGLGPDVRAAAEAEGYEALWAEPVVTRAGLVPNVLVIWTRYPGNPSPNQVSSTHQAAAILRLALA